jgi:hypothetical protein
LTAWRRYLTVFLALVIGLPLMVAGAGRAVLADVTTYAGEAGRSGWDGAEPGLASATVQSAAFHQLYSTAVSGQILGQPLVYQSTVVIGTQEDVVYGINAGDGAIRWATRLGTPQPVASVPQTFCRDITPYVGISTTPVIDPATGLLYVTVRTWDPTAAVPQAATWVLVALSTTDGHEVWRTPIHGVATNDAAAVFDPNHANQRPGLLLLNGWVYAGFGSFCDADPYRGWVAGINVATHAQTLWTDEAGGLGSPRAGIWQTGALASDGAGRILLVTGNGTVPPPGPGSAPPGALGNSAVRLEVGPGGALSAVDFFSPYNADNLAGADLDLGSGGMAAAPSSFPLPATLAGAHPHVAAMAGKEGRIYLLDRDHLGGEAQGAGGADDVVAEAGPFTVEGVFTRPAFWPGDGGYVYVTTSQRIAGQGATGHLRALRLDSAGNLQAAGTGALPGDPGASVLLGFGSGAPVVTSTATTAGSGVVWVVSRPDPGDESTDTGRLLAYGAVPDASGHLPLLRSFPVGLAAKFSAPATDQGRVFVATQDGHLVAFGQGQPAPPPGQGVLLDGWGGLHAYSSATRHPAIDIGGGPYWPGWDVARGVTMEPGTGGGYVLDAYGGIHRFGANTGPDYPRGATAYWGRWDIARGIATAVGGGGGYILDGWGGVHTFGGAPPIADSSHAYWPGWDIARAIAVRPDGISGYVLDGYGGVHAFGGAPEVSDMSHAYWPGWDIARALVLDPTGNSGWILDGYGGIHRFGPAGLPEWPHGDTAYWAGWDIARGITLLPGADASGYVLDGWGGLHAFGGAAGIPDTAHDGYWPGWKIARGTAAT